MFIRIKLLNLFCLNYASVYLMLNAVCETKLKSVDYKSIALPTELQGLNEFVLIILSFIKNSFLKNLNGEKQLLHYLIYLSFQFSYLYQY